MLHMEQWRIAASHERCANGAVSGGVCITPNTLATPLRIRGYSSILEEGYMSPRQQVEE